MTGPVPAVVAGVLLEHLGKLHPYEHLLVWVLAFGPVLLLAVTIHVARKRERQDD